jgi:hypothetical protein
MEMKENEIQRRVAIVEFETKRIMFQEQIDSIERQLNSKTN